MKIPRDVDYKKIKKLLKKLNYLEIKQVGSHVRFENTDLKHRITIPKHNPIKLGTLNNILNDLTKNNNLNKEEILNIIKSL